MPGDLRQPVSGRPGSSRETEHVPHISRGRARANQMQWSLSRLNRVSTAPMQIARATADCLDAVLGLIEDAKNWLSTKDTNQWAAPWPDEAARDARVFRGIQAGKTWIVWQGGIPAATVTTASRPSIAVWSPDTCECDLSERAVYAHRLIIARRYSGAGLGARLIDWVGLRGRHEYGAKWIRIDVWTSNRALHDYYRKTGFESCGFCADPTYPSGALFQKSISKITPTGIPLFADHGKDSGLRAARIPACAW